MKTAKLELGRTERKKKSTNPFDGVAVSGVKWRVDDPPSCHRAEDFFRFVFTSEFRWVIFICHSICSGLVESFFKNDEGHNVTVNGDRYRAMITNFFIPELNNHDVQKLWFQQDGATCHTARSIIDLLKDTFGDRLISRFGPVNWPPRSCDLIPQDFFLWGHVKFLVYADKPQTLDHL
ncbi:DUF4817 domain-containing protein [Trichonephila clavipes]|nr:DUF4817 domain-containing protein [Trichonephila clavipes]